MRRILRTAGVAVGLSLIGAGILYANLQPGIHVRVTSIDPAVRVALTLTTENGRIDLPAGSSAGELQTPLEFSVLPRGSAAVALRLDTADPDAHLRVEASDASGQRLSANGQNFTLRKGMLQKLSIGVESAAN